ncbi:MAG: mycofactocin-associated electron transfer flavoprotein alpha subunit [Actinomycetota bacterium]|nr:mycofactocin-associated electron transfer flavoprotein alpha subunit [Actinomycetota bacterium]
MIAVLVVQGGTLPAGADETAAEVGGQVVLVGDGTGAAADALRCGAEVACWEAGAFAPGRWAATLAPILDAHDVVVLPASPDGRDLAPRLAAAMGRPLVTGTVRVDRTGAIAATHGGRVHERYVARGPFVATLEPGCRGVGLADVPAERHVGPLAIEEPDGGGHAGLDAEILAVTPPDPAAMDLAESPRIFAGGAGLGDADDFALLGHVAEAFGASVGGTRVATDAGLLPHSRQIGTTGVTVRPRLYVAFGISGAVQHTGGLHDPGHVVSVNVDASCPMMAMADLALVADAPAVLRALAEIVATTPPGAAPPAATPPAATPPAATPPAATPPAATPPGATPPGATPPGATPPGATAPHDGLVGGGEPGASSSADAGATSSAAGDTGEGR